MKKAIVLIILIGCSAFGQSNDPGFILNANVGPSFRLAKIPDGLSADNEDYIRELKSGLSYDFSAYYVMHDRGYGLKYNVFRSKNERNNATNFDPLVNIPTSFSDDITISYIGPSFLYTELQDAKLGEAFIEVSFGYMSYKNKATINGQNFTIKGGNLGMIAGGGYHFRLHKQFLIGPQISFVGGTLRKFKYDFGNGYGETVSLDNDEYESLWRIDLSVSAKFRF
jgi:hypothetical protein